MKKNHFTDVLTFIDEGYVHTPTAFKNGNQNNAADENQGSARVLYFSRINNLSKNETLELFAEHYESVLNTPNGNDHQNIRQFQLHGWEGVSFDGEVLRLRQ